MQTLLRNPRKWLAGPLPDGRGTAPRDSRARRVLILLCHKVLCGTTGAGLQPAGSSLCSPRVLPRTTRAETGPGAADTSVCATSGVRVCRRTVFCKAALLAALLPAMLAAQSPAQIQQILERLDRLEKQNRDL